MSPIKALFSVLYCSVANYVNQLPKGMGKVYYCTAAANTTNFVINTDIVL